MKSFQKGFSFFVALVVLTLAACNPISDTKLGDEVFSNVVISLRNSTLRVSNPQVAVGSAVTVTLSLQDGGNQPYVSKRPKIVFSASGGVSAGTLSAVRNNGNGTYSATFTGVTPGSATTLRASVDGKMLLSTLPTLQVTLGDYDLSKSLLSVSSPTVSSGSSVTVTLTVKDSSNTQLSKGGLNVAFSHSGGTSTGNFSAVSDHLDGTYSATFTGVTAGTATTLQAAISGSAVTSTLPTVTVSAGAPSSIAVSSGNSQSVEAGLDLLNPLVAIVRDAHSNLVSGVSVNWAVTSGGGALSSCTTTTDASGLVQCTLTTGATPGANSVSASVAGVASPANFTAVGTTGTPTSVAVFSGNGQSATVGTAVSSPLVAVVKDVSNNIIEGVSVTWAVTGGGGAVSSCTTTTDASGLAQCTLTTGTTAGANTVTASVAGVGTPATFTATGTAGAAASIAVSSGNTQSAVAGSALTNPLVAVVRDANNNVKSGATVAWAVTGGGGAVSACTTTTDASGLAQCTLTTGTTAGANTVTAGVAGVATPATFSATGTVGAAASIAVSTGNAQSAVAGSALSNPLVAVVKDINNNVKSGVTVSWAVTGGGGAVSACTTTTNASGLVHCTLTTGTTAGANTVTASVAGIGTPATFSATGTAGGINNFLLSSVPSSATAGSSFNFTVTARDANNNTKTDYTGVVAFSSSDVNSPTLPGNYTFVLGDAGTKQFSSTLKTSGNQTLTVTQVSGASPSVTSSNIAVSASAATQLVFITNPVSTVAGNSIPTMLVRALDAFLNTATGYSGDITLSIGTNPGAGSLSGTNTVTVTAPAGSASFPGLSIDKTGTGYTLTASGTAGVSSTTSSTFNITQGAASSIAVSSGNTQSAVVGTALTNPLVAIVRDANSNAVSGVTVSWAVTGGGGAVSSCTTTTDASGLAQCTLTTGTTAGANTVTASVAGVGTPATFTATGTAGAAASIAVSSGNTQSAVAGSALTNPLVVVVRDANNNVKSGATVTWAVTGGGGSVSACTTTTDASGLAQCTLTTGTTAGANTVTASVAGVATPATFSATGTVGSIALATSLVSVSPTSIAVGATSTITLTAKDANGNAITSGGSTVTFSRATTAGQSAGTISATTNVGNGTYTAVYTATASGTANILSANIAALGTVASTASITVTNMAPVASAQSVNVVLNTPTALTLAGTDADGDALTYTVVGNPSNGTLSGTAPNLTYTPTSNYTGTDSFTFKVNDGTVDSSLATVSILVYRALQIAPSISIPRRGGYTYTFVPSGGVGAYTYSMASGSGSVDSSGVYTAGTTGSTATVRVTDSLGNTADSTINLYNSLVNGQVAAQAVDSSGNLYLGGGFTSVFPYSAPNAFALNTVSGAPELSFDLQSGFDGPIYALVRDPSSGAIYVGGDFTAYRGIAVGAIVKLDSYGNLDTSFNGDGSGFDGGVVNALALNSTGTTLYVGGQFTSYRGVADSARRIAKLSTSDGAIDTTFHPVSASGGFGSTVMSLALNSSGTTLYVGGGFTAYRGVASSARRIAKLSTSDGAIDTTFHPVSASGGFSGTVTSLALNSTGTTLYVGGTFGTYRGVANSARRIAKLSTNDGAIDTTFHPVSASGGFSDSVSALALNSSGTTLYVGGIFGGYRAVNARFIAKLSTSDGSIDTTFHPDSVSGGFNEEVTAFALNSTGTTLYVGGIFTTYRGVANSARGIAKLSTSDGAIDTTFHPVSSSSGLGEVSAIALNSAGTTLYAGGSFSFYRGVAVNRIAKFDSSGNLDTSFYPVSASGGFDAGVNAIVLNSTGTTLYVGGDFNAYRGVVNSARFIAKLSTSDGAIDTTFHPVSASGGFDSGGGASVSALALNSTGTTLYVGGSFTAYRGVANSARLIAKLSTSDGAIDTTFHPVSASGGFDGQIMALVLNSTGDSLYVGGGFGAYRGIASSARGIAKLSTSDGAIDTTFHPVSASGGFGVNVNALALNSSGTNLYVGGNFTFYRGVFNSAYRIAKLSTSDGSIDTAFHPVSATGGFNSNVSALALNSSGNTLYVGGSFTTYEGELCLAEAQLDPANGALILP